METPKKPMLYNILFSLLFLSLILIPTMIFSYSESDDNSKMDHKEGISNFFEDKTQKKISNEFKDSPLRQTKLGIFPSEVECKQGNVLLIKSNSKIPVCASPITATKLIERSWGVSSTTLKLSPENELKATSLAEKIVDKCHTKADCIVDSLKEVANDEENFLTLRTYHEIINWYEESLDYCHGLGHHLGMFLYDYKRDLDEALFYADQRCGLSQIHGVVEGYFHMQFNDTTTKLIDVNDICPEISKNKYSLDRWACLHGMGHGLAISFGYDVFSAIDRCDELASSWEKMSCSKGVFMENITESYRSDKATLDDDDILFPCNEKELKHSPECYHYQTNYIRSQPDYTVDGGFKICDGIQPQDMIRFCYYGMGRLNAGNSLDDYERALDFCSKGSEGYQQYCFTGTLSTLVSNRGTDQGFSYCKFLPIEFKKNCYDILGKWIIMFYPSELERKTECSKAENANYSEICLSSTLEDTLLL